MQFDESHDSSIKVSRAKDGTKQKKKKKKLFFVLKLFAHARRNAPEISML